MGNVFERWASMGLYVTGQVDAFEDPEMLIMDTIERIQEEGRYLGFLVTWLSKYGHLVLTKKLYFNSSRERSIFSAIVAESGSRETKLLHMIEPQTIDSQDFLYSDLLPVLKERTRLDPNPSFLKQGILLKNFPLLQPKLLLPTSETFQRNTILRYRALFGASLRSDVAAILPGLEKLSVLELAHRLHVTSQAVTPIIYDLEQSGLVNWTRKGRYSYVQWNSQFAYVA